MRIYGIAIVLATAAGALCVSCSRDGDVAQDGERRELAISVQMQSSDWTTRANASANPANASPANMSTPVALDEQLEIVTEYGTQEAQEMPLTRGTPIISAAGLKSLGFAVYTNSVFTKNCTATNSGSSWSIAGNMTVDVDKNKYSYYAYAPTAAGDNGIKLNEADGKSLTYTAPTDITKQPDLCWATPILNNNTGTANFAMQHALTAVGIKVRAANVTIKSITLKQVNTAGTLNLTNGTWGSVTTPKDLTFTLNNTKPSTGDGLADLIASDGYLMLPPQSLSGDNQTLVIKYQYKDEAEKTGTHKLSDITGGNWTAGQKINYVIQLKSNFSLTLTPESAMVPYAAGSYTFGYTTGSSAPAIDPQVSYYDPSVVNGFVIDRAKRTISFNYAQNTSKGAPRQTKIKVTSGFTTKDFTLTQDGLYVLIAGTYWTKSNLTGTYGTNAGHAMEANPQGYGAFFKWGTTFVYQRASSNSDGGGWGGETTGAATSPSSSSTGGDGYDYGSGLGGGLNPGDPCQKLGSNYRTPTFMQWVALRDVGYNPLTTYQGVNGYFFGPNAGSCNNTTIQPGCIFLPLSGCRSYSNGTQYYQGDHGFYWSSTVYDSNYSHDFYFQDGGTNPGSASGRGSGFSVRCIYE